PVNEAYHPAGELIELLIQTRARGGNLLLNVGPQPAGEPPIEQEDRLRELGLWHFAFGESIHEVRPWVVTNEGNVWFTRRKNTLYPSLTKTSWTLGERKSFTVRSVRATAGSKLTLLGTT